MVSLPHPPVRAARLRAPRSSLLLAALPLALAACGGGGDDDDSAGTAGFKISATVAGLDSGKTLVLQNNGGDDLSVSANGSQVFTAAIAGGGAYSVTVKTPPAGQQCVVANGSGTASADVGDITVTCSAAVAGGVQALAGDWELRRCTRLGAASSARTLVRVTPTSDTGFTWGSGLVQYGSADCTGTGSPLPPTTIGQGEITSAQSAAGIAAHWTRMALVTGIVNHMVWSKTSATELCVIGDQNPSLFANAGAVLQSINLSPDGVCYVKR
jgi:hypothetical protein